MRRNREMISLRKRHSSNRFVWAAVIRFEYRVCLKPWQALFKRSRIQPEGEKATMQKNRRGM